MNKLSFLFYLFPLFLAGCAHPVGTMPDAPFGWANSVSLTEGDLYNVTGGGDSDVVVLTSDGSDMRQAIDSAALNHRTIVLDGSCGDFVISSSINFRGLKDRTFIGINGARLCTGYRNTPEIRALLDSLGVKAMSDQGGGGFLSNGAFVYEEREQHTRQAIIDYTGDLSERYRRSGIFTLNACENIIIRNLAFVGPGPIDVGAADLLTVSNGTKHLWVDHCSFTDGMDGNFDINSRSDFITVSWCTFQYTDNAYDHKATNLIGSSENPDQGVDNLNVTFAYCIWGSGCEVRMPAVRWGTIHLLNDWYNCAGNGSDAVYSCKGSSILMEGCYFDEGVKKIFLADPGSEGVTFRDNIFVEDFTPTDNGSVSVPYEYKIIPASRVPSVLRSHAGPLLNFKNISDITSK